MSANLYIVRDYEEIRWRIKLLLGIHYYHRYAAQALYITGRFNCYIPEQGIVVIAFALGYRSHNDGSTEESGLFLGINDVPGSFWA
ncbi:MAG: hypothetical protein ACYTFW_15295 [Planctomycetota bacterium]|jgi:hypothetical protein